MQFGNVDQRIFRLQNCEWVGRVDGLAIAEHGNVTRLKKGLKVAFVLTANENFLTELQTAERENVESGHFINVLV